MNIEFYLKTLVERGGSDLHLKVGRPPLMRIKGDLIPTEFPVVERHQMEQLIMPMMSEYQRKKLEKEKEMDFSYLIEGVARFRGNIFFQLGEVGAVFRTIPLKIKTIDELGLPPVLKELIFHRQGLILVTGPTGSGKSTTLASMLDLLNESVAKHIVSIEDPIEFVHTDKKCTINQREVGYDTLSFTDAIKRALRQDPDVILVGEMRDPETIRTALTASETGHLVLSTLHTNYARQSISRIIDAFPPEEQHHIRVRLATSLVAALAQKLIKKSDESGMAVVMEIMINTPTIRKSIAEEKLDQIDKLIHDSAELYKMQTLNQHLFKYIKEGVLTPDDAFAISNNPNDLKVMLQTQSIYAKEQDKKAGFGAQRPDWMKSK